MKSLNYNFRRPTCPVPPTISTDQLASGYDYNYREMKEKRKCDVCGDVSAGFHCSAFVCEACKVKIISIINYFAPSITITF